MSSICLNLKLPYNARSTTKPYQVRDITSQFHKFEGRRGNIREHVVRFLNSMGARATNMDLCIREHSESLIGQAYTWYINLKPGLVNDREHLIFLFNTKFFCQNSL